MSRWLHAHALGVAIASLVVALGSLTFGFIEFAHHAETPQPTLAATAPDDQTLAAASVIATGSRSGPSEIAASAPAQGPREIQRAVRVLEPNYTIQTGDTLNGIAAQFHTTVDRIQAWNDLPNPRALRVGTKLVIPPAF